jgi:hypothetical protein
MRCLEYVGGRMDNPERILIEKKIEALENQVPKIEYVLDGPSVGMEGLVPCVIDADGGDTCSVTIADGPHTGESLTVEKKHVTALGTEFFEDAVKRLFR